MDMLTISRFSGLAKLWNVVFSILLMISIPSVRIHVTSLSDVRLEYTCTEPDTVSGGPNREPVIMMHALFDIKESWNGIYENVSKLTNRKVCIYDARNHGGSSWNDTCTIDSTVEDLETFMDMMKIDRAVLVGHSLGGHTGMKFALSHPDKVEALFVEDIGPSVPDIIAEIVGYFTKVLQRSIRKIPDGANKTTAEQTILKYIRKYTGEEMRMKSYLKHMPIHLQDGVWEWKTNVKAIDKALDDVQSVFTKMEGKYEGKTVFLYSKESLFGVIDQIEDIKELFPKVKFISLESARHFIHYFYPGYLKHLLDFMN